MAETDVQRAPRDIPPTVERWATGTPAALIASIGAFAVCMALTVRYGFNPTDEGLIVGYARRLAQGDVPHRDFIFSRPVGSSVLHLVDLVLPTPLFMTSRVIGAGQIYVYTLLLGCLAAGRRVRTAPPLLLAAVVVAAVVNVHSLPLMAWYTVDGLFLVAVGAYLLRWTDRWWVRAIALLALGYAPLCKQSFFLAPVIGLWFLLRYHPSQRRPIPVLGSLVVLGLPGLAYLVWMQAAGAIDPMITQFTGVPPVYGKELFTDLTGEGAFVAPLVGLALIAAVWWGARSVQRRAGEPSTLVRLALVLGAVAVVALPIGLVLASRWKLVSPYGTQILWMAVAVVVIGAVLRRRFYDGVLLSVVAGWMSMLSIGYPKASYVAGSMALALAVPVLTDVRAAVGPLLPVPGGRRVKGRAGEVIVGAAVGVLALAMGLPFVVMRNDHLYREWPARELTGRLGELSPELAGIQTNPLTFDYLRWMRDCVDEARRRGAVRIAVVPDNPGLYPALDLNSPLPNNSLFPQEFFGSERRVIDSFGVLNESPDRVAVLYQVIDPALLPVIAKVTMADEDTPLFAHFSPVLVEAYRQQLGESFFCGPFEVRLSGGGG